MFTSFSLRKLFFAAIVSFNFVACNSGDEIPFPSSDPVFPQPPVQPLKFDSATKIDWPGKVSILTPTEKKISFEKFPARVFDSSGFRPFPKQPSKLPINIDGLADTVFNYDALPSFPLHYKTTLLEPPQIIKGRKPFLKQPKNGQIYSLGEPLSSRQVQCFYQSKDGMIWIANDRGLYRYDGDSYIFYAIPGKASPVFSMTEDKTGRLWIGTQNEGIFILDVPLSIMMHIGYAERLLSNTCPRILFDNSNRAWISCVPSRFNYAVESSVESGGGVSIIDFEAKTLKHFTSAQGLSKNAASGIIQDHKSNIWIGTLFGSLTIVNAKEKKLKKFGTREGLATNMVTDLYMDADERIWVSGWFGDISIIDQNTKLITNIGGEQGIPNVFMSTISGDSLGNVWIGCFNYVCSINKALSGIKIFNSKKGLDGTTNSAIHFTSDNKMWVSTTDGPNLISVGEKSPHYINTKDISTLSQDKNGRIWIGHLGGNGIQIVDTSSKSSKSFTTAEGLSDNAVQAFMQDEDRTWIASLERGIDVINISSNTLSHIGIESGLRNNQIFFLSKDKTGNAWTGYNNIAGIDRIHLQDRIIHHLGREQGFKDSAIVDVIENNDGTFWFSSLFNGIGFIDTSAKTIKHISNIPALQVVGLNNYMMLLNDTKNNLWIATSSGLVLVNDRRDSFMIFTSKEGLCDNAISSVNEYDGKIYAGTNNGLNVITKTVSGSWQINTVADKADGVSKNAGSYDSDLITANGDYWWGDEGITVIPKLNNLNKDSQSYHPGITGFDILGKAQQLSAKLTSGSADPIDTVWSGTKDTFYINGNYPVNKLTADLKWDGVTPPYNLPENLRLPYHKNYLQFHYSLRQPGNNDTVIYRYILQGIDRQWSDRTRNTNTENYLNLPSGEYIFKVIAFVNNHWTEPVSFEFTIMPPWWRTWWAYIIYILVFSSVVWSIIKYRSRWLKRENQRLEQMVEQRTNELSQSLDELKSTQSQLIQSEKMASLGELTAGIAHEIQNPLNFVNNFSEVNTELAAELKEEIDKLTVPEQTKKELAAIIGDMVQNQDKITFHGKRADAIVKGMLQHSRGGSGQKEPTDINVLADEYLRLSYHGLRAKDKSFNADIKTDFDSSLPLLTVVSQEIGRAMLNLFTNAFYSVSQKKALGDAGYKPTLEVSTKRIGNKVQILVKDNGMGVPQRILDKIFQPFFTTKPTGEGTGLGLSLTYDIITKVHGGELKVETKEGEGAEFIILLPL